MKAIGLVAGSWSITTGKVLCSRMQLAITNNVKLTLPNLTEVAYLLLLLPAVINQTFNYVLTHRILLMRLTH